MNRPHNEARGVPAAVALLFLAVLTSCGGVRSRTLTFVALDDTRQRLPCMIVVEDMWPATREEAHFTMPASTGEVEVDFTDRDRVQVELVPVEWDADQGEVERLPQPGERHPVWWCPHNRRLIDHLDPPRNLFLFYPR